VKLFLGLAFSLAAFLPEGHKTILMSQCLTRQPNYKPIITYMNKASRDIIIRTTKWSKAIQFYTSVLGLPITSRDASIVGFETGSFCLYVEKGPAHGPVFEFLVQDVQATKQKLLTAGCVVLEENPSVPRCYIRDPYGIVFNIGKASSAA
jgi:predicted enzyme related to lactoylglutathione lyase